jgi:hypothetical protein
VGKTEGKRPLGRPRCRCEDNTDLKGVGLGGMGSVDLAENWDQWRAFVNTVMNL